MSSGLAGPRGKPWEAGVSVSRAGGGVRPGDSLCPTLLLAPAGGGSCSTWKRRGRGLRPRPSWPAAPPAQTRGGSRLCSPPPPPPRKPLCRVERPGATSASAPAPSGPCVSSFARRERLRTGSGSRWGGLGNPSHHMCPLTQAFLGLIPVQPRGPLKGTRAWVEQRGNQGGVGGQRGVQAKGKASKDRQGSPRWD